jgi:hypothetical protein
MGVPQSRQAGSKGADKGMRPRHKRISAPVGATNEKIIFI